METILFLLLAAIAGTAFVFTEKIKGITKEAEREQDRLKFLLKKYDGLNSREEFEKKLDMEIVQRKKDLRELSHETEQLKVQIRSMREQLGELQEEDYFQSFGLYVSKYKFENSSEYQNELDAIKAKQKEMIKSKTAAVCHQEWEVQGSKRKGKKMVDDSLRLILMAFNGECVELISKVRYNNVDSVEKKIVRLFETLNKLSKTTDCEITSQYLSLKLEELYTSHELTEKKQEELEEQRRIQQQIREEERVRRETDKAQKEAERDEQIYQKALAKARQELEDTDDMKKRANLELKVKEMEIKLAEVQVSKANFSARAQMSKSGFIYVISNLGSFGKDIYRIGMTRRLEPSTCISEFSLSVPFPFDIHAMIFSEDAIEMERRLHQNFGNRRVNRINERREFFNVSLDEIANAVKTISQETGSVKSRIEFTQLANAEEYHKTLALVQTRNQN